MILLVLVLVIGGFAAMVICASIAAAWRNECLRVERDRDRLLKLLAAYERIDEITIAAQRAIRARMR